MWKLVVAMVMVVIVSLAFIGSAVALDCVSCQWTVQNDTVDHGCLGAPYKMPTTTCPEPELGTSPMECMTHAKFSIEEGIMSLEMLERKCGAKHSHCNNACATNKASCWLCCDNDKCNGFPLRGNIVYVSVASRTGSGFLSAIFVLLPILFQMVDI